MSAALATLAHGTRRFFNLFEGATTFLYCKFNGSVCDASTEANVHDFLTLSAPELFISKGRKGDLVQGFN